MPVYQYRDVKRNVLVELLRPVADRDQVPAELVRITVPLHIAIHGSSSSPMDPHTADAEVPRAFRQLEQTMPAREIAREGGFSVEKIKEVWNM